MAIAKEIKTDKIETVQAGDHYNLQVRERIVILEDGVEISSSFHRYALNPDAETKKYIGGPDDGKTVLSKITDPTVLAQFKAVMTDQVKSNYQKFLEN